MRVVNGIALVVAVSLGGLALVACQPQFAATPCPGALLQQTPTFPDGQAIVNDCPVTISRPSDVTAKRDALTHFIWGPDGFPAAKLPASVQRNVPSPVSGLANLGRVDRLNITMDAGQHDAVFHMIPRVNANDRLVIVHQGHTCTLDDSQALTDDGPGMQRMINGLLSEGYSVLAAYMPHMNDQLPDPCVSDHDLMFRTITTIGSPLKFFLEPLVEGLNYLQTRADQDQFPHYRDYSMVGLSGGGWTTTVYAALDPRITLSVPVAGSIPLYLRFNDPGDTEQELTQFYAMAHYPDLYVMGSYGRGRRQVWVLNRRDDCCFGEAQFDPTRAGMSWEQGMRRTETQVRHALYGLGAGSFRLEIDDASPAHMISWNTVVNTVLSELDRARPSVGAATRHDAFARGANGTLWQSSAFLWRDTTIPMVGVPAAVQGAVRPFDVFFRNPSNQLTRAFPNGRGWTLEPLGATVITDPVAAGRPGSFDVVALGPDYRPYHWWSNGAAVLSEPVGNGLRALGPPALLATAGRVDVFVRGFDRAVHHLRKLGTGPWTDDLVGGTIVGFPTAVATSDPSGTTRSVFVVQDGRLWEAESKNDGPWQWSQVASGVAVPRLLGSPSASNAGDAVVVYARTAAGTLARFVRVHDGWAFTDAGGLVADSPASIGGAAYVVAPGGALWLFDGTRWIPRGGRLD
jgi:hypothetical protein